MSIPNHDPIQGPQGWSPRTWWTLLALILLLVFGYAVYDFFADDPPPEDGDMVSIQTH